jgi:4-amino-4-deoxy-L-arabinose transferase-like glycosyltransferase
MEAYSPIGYWLDWVGWWTIRSFLGAFGYMDIFLNERGVPIGSRDHSILQEPLYLIFALFIAACFLSWILWLRKAEDKESSPVQWLGFAFLAVIVLLFLRFNAQFFQGQARYLFPAIASISMIVGIGVVHAARQRWPIAAGIIAALLLAVNVYALMRLPSEFEKRTTPLSQMPSNKVERGGHAA